MQSRIRGLLVIATLLVASLGSSNCAMGDRSADGSPALFPVPINGKWEFVDLSGHIKIQPQFDWVWDFGPDGVTGACVGSPDCDRRKSNQGTSRAWQVIDTDGRPVGNGRFFLLQSFSEGLAGACVEPLTEWNSLSHKNETTCTWWRGKWGFVDVNGGVAIEPRFMRVEPFHDGIAAVCVADCFSWGAGRWGYIDKKGHEMVSARFDGAGSFGNGLAPVKLGKVWGYVSSDGDLKIQPQFGEAGAFSNGIARACLGQESVEDKRCGFIDTSGRFVINPQFADANAFAENRALVRIKSRWGYIDPAGKIVIPAQYARAVSFADTLAAVCIEQPGGQCKWGFIDQTGKMVIDPQFDEPAWFHHGLALAVIKVGDELKIGLIDKRGRYVVNPSKFEEHS